MNKLILSIIIISFCILNACAVTVENCYIFAIKIAKIIHNSNEEILNLDLQPHYKWKKNGVTQITIVWPMYDRHLYEIFHTMDDFKSVYEVDDNTIIKFQYNHLSRRDETEILQKKD